MDIASGRLSFMAGDTAREVYVCPLPSPSLSPPDPTEHKRQLFFFMYSSESIAGQGALIRSLLFCSLSSFNSLNLRHSCTQNTKMVTRKKKEESKRRERRHEESLRKGRTQAYGVWVSSSSIVYKKKRQIS